MSDDVVELGDLSDLGDGEMRCFREIGPDGIVVCRVGSELFALTDNCSHADAPLSEGRLRGYALTCPVHGTSFDVRSGAHSGPPAWEGVAAHDVTESNGVATVRVAGRTSNNEPPDPAGGTHLQSR